MNKARRKEIDEVISRLETIIDDINNLISEETDDEASSFMDDSTGLIDDCIESLKSARGE